MKRVLAAAIGLLLSFSVIAADCEKKVTACIDSTPTKLVNGINVTLAQAGGCWKYEDTYECIKPGGANYCQPLDDAGCNQTSAECTKYAFNGTCEQWTRTYRCGNAVGNPTGTVILDNTYTIVKDELDYTQCQAIEDNSACQIAEVVCTEGPETRNINGLDVYKDCWAYEQRYVCSAGTFANYCAPLQAQSCIEATTAVCLQSAWNGECILFERTYNCDAKVPEPLPANVTYLDSSYTIVNDSPNLSLCTSLADNPNCTFSGKVCVEGPETRNINGLDVFKDCWKWEDTYACASETLVSNCDELKARPECVETSAPTCVDTLPGGQCGLLEHTYECNIGSGGIAGTTTDCSTQKFCLGGKCFDSSYAPDTDLGKVVAGMETLREAGAFDLFKGEAGFCERKLFGLSNCCKSESGGASSSNFSVANELGIAAVKFGAESVYAHGSRYAFEALMNTGSGFLQEIALNSLATGFASNFSVWGAEFSYSVAEGLSFVGFDPWSLAFSIALKVIMTMMECDDESKEVAIKKGQGLCHKVGSFCDKKTLGACMTKKESYCCFVSKLARIINEQGRPQIGKSWGAPKGPDCSGFTVVQLQQLSFDQMNFSEFFSSITVPSKTSSYAIERLNTKAQSYYGQ